MAMSIPAHQGLVKEERAGFSMDTGGSSAWPHHQIHLSLLGLHEGMTGHYMSAE